MIEGIVAIGLLLIFFVFRSKLGGLKIKNRLDDMLEKKRAAQLKVVNRLREDYGLKALEPDFSMHAVAKGHSLAMAESGVCGHNGEEARFARIQQLSGSRFVRENCFKYPRKIYGKRIDGRLAQTWLRSPQNRANILNPRFNKIGIGVVSRKGQVYTTQLFSG